MKLTVRVPWLELFQLASVCKGSAHAPQGQKAVPRRLGRNKEKISSQ